jgi:hypothetical protein
LIFLAFLVPLACYCLFLALINRSRHPVVIPGTWDFAAILFAVSGFLIMGGPAALTGLHERWRMALLLGDTRFLLGAGEPWHIWVTLSFLYFAIVVGGSAAVLWRRRGETSIYNIRPAVFEEVLRRVVDRLGLEATPSGPQRLVIHRRDEPSGEEFPASSQSYYPEVAAQAGTSDGLSQRAAMLETISKTYGKSWSELELDFFPSMWHVTLHWRGSDGAIRHDVESELTRALRETYTDGNPAGVWLLSLALCLFFASALGLCAVVILRILQFPR